MICAQKIFGESVYFPETTLKPKHHFMRHYPAQILKFGPLIRVWMMRFESKHSYFKRHPSDFS